MDKNLQALQNFLNALQKILQCLQILPRSLAVFSRRKKKSPQAPPVIGRACGEAE